MNKVQKDISFYLSLSQKNQLEKTINEIFLQIDKNEAKYPNQFISLTKKIADDQVKKLQSYSEDKILFGVPYTAKDNICTFGHRTTGACKILDNFVPNYNAHILDKLSDAGAVLVGKNNLDELGMEGTGTASSYGHLSNPWDSTRISGGSSSGSAVSVATGIVPFSIGTDTGDSVRQPANYCGILGFKPSWNRISRFGIIPYTPSLDTVGIFAKSAEDVARVYETISGYDPKDATSLQQESDKIFTNNEWNKEIKNKKIVIIQEIYDELLKKPELLKLFDKQIETLKNNNNEIYFEKFDVQILNALLSTYNILSYSEAISCQAYLQGISFGERIEGHDWQKTIANSRSVFTRTTKFRQIMGSYFLLEENRVEFFQRAKKVRRIIHNKMKHLFQQYDALILPCSGIAPTIAESKKHRSGFLAYNLLNDHLLLANFYGSPSISLPVGFVNKMPFAISINTNQFSEGLCLSFANFLEKNNNWNNRIAGDFSE